MKWKRTIHLSVCSTILDTIKCLIFSLLKRSSSGSFVERNYFSFDSHRSFRSHICVCVLCTSFVLGSHVCDWGDWRTSISVRHLYFSSHNNENPTNINDQIDCHYSIIYCLSRGVVRRQPNASSSSSNEVNEKRRNRNCRVFIVLKDWWNVPMTLSLLLRRIIFGEKSQSLNSCSHCCIRIAAPNIGWMMMWTHRFVAIQSNGIRKY